MLDRLKQSWSVFITMGPAELVSRSYGYLALKIVGVKAYQKPITHLLRQLAGTHTTFIDIGAASGDIVQVAGPSFKRVLAIEPAPHHLKELNNRKDKGLLGNATILEYAVGNRNGKAKLGLSASNPDDNSLFQREGLSEYVEVQERTIDRIVAEMKLPTPIAIKIDIQGFEGHFIEGASATLDSGCAIIMEFWPWGLKRAGTKPDDLLATIRDKGYSICRLSGRKYSTKRLLRMTRTGQNNRFIVADLLLTPTSKGTERR